MGSRGRAALALAGVALTIGLSMWAWKPGGGTLSPAELVSRLGYPETSIESYQRLDRTTDPALRAAVVAGLAHDNACVRVRCARLLAHQDEDVVGVDELERLLDDPDRNVRSQAASTFMQLAPWERVATILNDARKPFRTRAALLEGMVADTVEAAEATLLRVVAARGENVRLRVHAAWLLRKYPSARQQAALERVADDASEDLDLRGAATRSRGSGASPAVIRRLAALAGDTTAPWRLREAAVLGIGLSKDLSQAPWLLALAADPMQPSQLRDNALLALGYLHTRAATDYLVTQLASERVSTRSKAAEGLARAKDPSTLPAIEAALRIETDPDVECHLRDALCGLGKKDH